MAIEPRELALAALSETFAQQRADLVAQAEPSALADAVSQYRESMIQLRKLDEADRKKAVDRLLSELRPIGAKLRPEMSPDQASRWAGAIAASLARWPFRVALAAVKQAVTEPFPYGIGSVDARLHELAEAEEARHQTAIWRLEKLRDEIEAARNPPPAIEQQPKIWTQAEVDEANAIFVRVGIKTRYVWKEGDVEPDSIELTADELEQERQRNLVKAGEQV